MRPIVLFVIACVAWAGDPLAIHPPVWKPLVEAGADAMELRLRERSAEAARASAKLVAEKWPSPVVFAANSENVIRSPTGQVRLLGAAVWLGLGSEAERQQWRRLASRLCVDLAKAHKANGGVWGDAWQSALWAGNLARGAWMLGDALTPGEQTLVAKVIAHESDRWISRPPEGWSAKDKMGGDSKGEENGWNSSIVVLAVAMLRDHPNRQAWLRTSVSYIMTAVGTRRDLEDATAVNGRMIKEWVPAWCLSDEGFVVNHNIYPHPDYTRVSMAAGPAIVIYTFAGMEVPVALRHNLRFIYDNFSNRIWPVPPYAAAGPIYQPDGSIAWPGRGEAERAKEVLAYLGADLTIRLAFPDDPALSASAAAWARRHLERADATNAGGVRRVNSGIDSNSMNNLLSLQVLRSGAVRLSAAATAAGVAQ